MKLSDTELEPTQVVSCVGTARPRYRPPVSPSRTHWNWKLVWFWFTIVP